MLIISPMVSQDSKPIHILKELNEDFPLKKTPHKNMQMEVNDVIFKMANFAQFCPKTGQISRMVHAIMTNYTIIFILKSRSIQWYNSF